MEGRGFIQVQATTAGQALPLPFAKITISRVIDGEPVLLNLIETDANGIAVPVEVEAPDKALSERPGNAIPYAVYEVEVGKEGYYTQLLEGVQVFDGQTALIFSDLVPLPETENGSRVRSYEIAPHTLTTNGGERNA